MIAKLEVRRQLAAYENKLREEIQIIEAEIEKINNDCKDSLMLQQMWIRSNVYYRLSTKLSTLRGVLNDIIDMRCSKVFEEE